MRTRYFLLVICIVLISAATASVQSVESVYTDLSAKKCKTLEMDTSVAGYSLQRCPGIAGYKLLVEEGDLRQSITVVRPDGSKHHLNFMGVISTASGFSSVGPKAEWRVKRQRGRLVPIALITRFNVSEDPMNTANTTSYLTVTKITPQQICVTDAVRPRADANEEARRLADDAANRPCPPLPE